MNPLHGATLILDSQARSTANIHNTYIYITYVFRGGTESNLTSPGGPCPQVLLGYGPVHSNLLLRLTLIKVIAFKLCVLLLHSVPSCYPCLRSPAYIDTNTDSTPSTACSHFPFQLSQSRVSA